MIVRGLLVLLLSPLWLLGWTASYYELEKMEAERE